MRVVGVDYWNAAHHDSGGSGEIFDRSRSSSSRYERRTAWQFAVQQQVPRATVGPSFCVAPA